jgi:hypothetical protein
MKIQDPPIYRVSYELSVSVLRFARDMPDKYQANYEVERSGKG